MFCYFQINSYDTFARTPDSIYLTKHFRQKLSEHVSEHQDFKTFRWRMPLDRPPTRACDSSVIRNIPILRTQKVSVGQSVVMKTLIARDAF